jgi:hypothetical protein
MTPKSIVTRLTELGIPCSTKTTKKVLEKMNSLGVSSLQDVLEELVNDDKVETKLKEKGWYYILLFKWRCGFKSFDESLINSVIRLGNMRMLKENS